MSQSRTELRHRTHDFADYICPSLAVNHDWLMEEGWALWLVSSTRRCRSFTMFDTEYSKDVILCDAGYTA